MLAVPSYKVTRLLTNVCNLGTDTSSSLARLPKLILAYAAV
jgi:hypothetical protein